MRHSFGRKKVCPGCVKKSKSDFCTLKCKHLLQKVSVIGIESMKVIKVTQIQLRLSVWLAITVDDCNTVGTATCRAETEMKIWMQGNMQFQQQVEVPSKKKCRHDSEPFDIQVERGMKDAEKITLKFKIVDPSKIVDSKIKDPSKIHPISTPFRT